MAKMNLEYYTNVDQYSDGNIENKMLKIAEAGRTLGELRDDEISFPIIYHFSQARENILNWYPFKEKASVLEIGAGCGAITGMLCRKASKVVAVELSKRRALINFARHKDYENLEIMVGNLNDMVFSEKFDYVVLNGVLEYAASFTVGEKPYQTFLENMKQYLKEDGRFLVAIENRLGLKYFSGAPEDHTDLYFHGIEHYPNNHSVKTFSKKELQLLLENSGFSAMQFYYPYPDYKFPTEIFTDASIGTDTYGRPYKGYAPGRIKLFDENVVAHDLAKEGVAEVFANSFLVEASVIPYQDADKIEYVKINSERKEEFQIYTAIHAVNNGKYVTKEALSEKSAAFVNRVGSYSEIPISENYSNLSCQCEGGRMSYPFIYGKTMMDCVYECIEQEDKKRLVLLIEDFYNSYFKNKKIVEDIYSGKFLKVFGGEKGTNTQYECISPANIDMICDNIFIQEKSNIVIDYEWYFDFPVPVAFIMWRMLNEMYHKAPKLHDLVSLPELWAHFGVDAEDVKLFFEWSKHFAYEYVGCDYLDKYAVEDMEVDLKDVFEENYQKHCLQMKLYYDNGNGLNENDVIESKVKLVGNRFKVRFDLSDVENAGFYRWDITAKPGRIYIDRLNANCQFGLLPQGDYRKNRDSVEFCQNTFSFIVDTFQPDKVLYLEIEGRIKFFEIEDFIGKYAYTPINEVARPEEETVESKDVKFSVIAEEMPVGLIRKIKNRLYGKSAANQMPPYYTPSGSVDDFRYENNVLHCRGWAFDGAHPDAKGKIVYYVGNNKVYEHKYILIHRSDVAQVLQNEAALKSGYTFTAYIMSPETLTVVLEFDTGSDTGKFIIGEVPANQTVKTLQIELCDGDGQIGDMEQFVSSNVLCAQEIPAEVFGYEIDIIIPVYNGYEYFEELFASLELTNMRYRLLIVNDKSPDERVLPFLEAYANTHDNVVLMNNEQNLGFVKSVNRALACATNHVVLLNTDVVVPYQWLERLMTPIICQEKVATTTPFTTCGTLCSFPQFGKDNKLVEDLSLWQMDDQFRLINPKYPEIPTGVGFCMGMNIHAINTIGALDAETFGKGYGEENDWCRRAKGAGYKNVHVDNLFVYHKHGGSFLSEEKQKLLERNSKALLEKHPDYNEVVASYFNRDPLKATRNYVLMKLWNQLTEIKTVVAFNHNLGGGATEYLSKKKQEYLRDGYKFITITYDIDNSRYLVDYCYKKETIAFSTHELEWIIASIGRVDEIWINELVTYREFYKTLYRIVAWKKEQSAELRVLLHDYFPVCPAINLMDENGKYCDVGSVERCQECIANNISNACEEYETAQLWRKNWRNFLEASDKIIAFSEISVQLLRKAYPDLNNIVLIPHKPYYVPGLSKKAKITKTLNIGFLGILSYKKGLAVVEELAKEIKKQGLDVRLKLIGEADEVPEGEVFSQTGRYSREQLPRLTMEQDIDIFFIPAIWPETFSYTTSEIMSMNMPIAVFDIGAPVERVRKYEQGLVLECDASPSEVLQKIIEFAELCGVNQMPVNERKTLFLAQEVSFASRYRVEHFREQLLHHGHPSDYYQISEIDGLEIASYNNVVIYRCDDVTQVKSVVQKAKAANIPVYYDIDDFIFAYDEITYLDFLKAEEYKDFESMTKRIHQCMNMCDGFLTSTETLKKLISMHFPNKPVVVKRNVASMEMQILSYNAAEEKEDNGSDVWIGYFSGSGTHNKDFDIVESVLDEIMAEYPNVHLRLGGVIKDSILKKYTNRIEKLPFMDWKKLPKAVSSVDINLMPLEDTEFHCSKSENKWTEAAFVKVPSVMTRNKEMELVVNHGENGMLCSSKEEWKKVLISLIEDKQLRARMGENAYKAVLERYTTYNSGQEAIDFVTR